MKSKLMFLTFAIAVLAGVTSVAAPPSTQVSLSISPSKTLPGLSLPLALRIRTGASAVELAPSIRVRATSPTGETFVALWVERIESGPLEFGLTDEEDDRFIIPANSTIDLAVPAVPFTQESWAHDGRLVSMPGPWKLEVLLYNERDGSTFTSSPATLEIETPAANDVWIWQALQHGEVWSIADKILSEQPESPYFPYFATLVRRHSSLDKVAILNRAIELHPNSPVVPSLRYAIADYYGAEADRVFVTEDDLEKAVALAEKGRAELVRLKNGKDAWSKLKGNQRAGDYPNRDGYVELQRVQREKGTRKP